MLLQHSATVIHKLTDMSIPNASDSGASTFGFEVYAPVVLFARTATTAFERLGWQVTDQNIGSVHAHEIATDARIVATYDRSTVHLTGFDVATSLDAFGQAFSTAFKAALGSTSVTPQLLEELSAIESHSTGSSLQERVTRELPRYLVPAGLVVLASILLKRVWRKLVG